MRVFLLMIDDGGPQPPAIPPPPETVDARVVARWANVTRDRVYEWVRTKQLAAIHVGPRSIRFDANEVRTFLRNKGIVNHE